MVGVMKMQEEYAPTQFYFPLTDLDLIFKILFLHRIKFVVDNLVGLVVHADHCIQCQNAFFVPADGFRIALVSLDGS